MSASPPAQPDLSHPDRKTIRSLFNAISPKYDFLNTFLSFGLHFYWRRKLVQKVTGWQLSSERSILDLGAGTGKSLAAFISAYKFERVVGCDFSESMLREAKKRLPNQVNLVSGDFHELPFPAETFDLVTGSFMLRSVQNMTEFLLEVRRVLKPGGKAAFLELTRPKNPFIWKFLYQPYLRFFIPFFGRFFSCHDHAYQFLSQSVQAFVEPEDLKEQFDSAGFPDVSIEPLSFGAASIISARCRP
ncbi:MAG: ubiquinone/menaquinone biosynthesis methyltransferase [Candidatus Omnitrophica bacterium]|nr:ubiquinone/menaquinone biosynthesis methyltransferase [Candidatus Omnitrophota bacterium]